jgi:transcriptional regulator with PAS, ATPase and Fis domain
VLIQGETGTGKELVARSIHKLSPRSEKRFMAINCGAFTDDLMDNELFGHEKEAFTGASQRKKGMLEAADGGVVFFDEIGELGLHMQVKLLRVLQERRFLRVGGIREVPIDIQVIAATNKDLSDMVQQGTFREDLYYRLNVIRLNVPPLRERADDLPLLLAHFLEKHATAGRRIESVSPEVLETLHSHDFPGNVRELENLVLRALTLGKGGVFDMSCLPKKLRCRHTEECPAAADPMPTLAEMERRYLAKVLAASEGNKTRAAAILGIDRVSLWRKIKKYGL